MDRGKERGEKDSPLAHCNKRGLEVMAF